MSVTERKKSRGNAGRSTSGLEEFEEVMSRVAAGADEVRSATSSFSSSNRRMANSDTALMKAHIGQRRKKFHYG